MARAVNETVRWQTISNFLARCLGLTASQIGQFISDAVEKGNPFRENHYGIRPDIGRRIWRRYRKYLRLKTRGARS